MATYDELMAKSRSLAAEGRTDEARRVAEIALKTRGGKEGNWFQRNILPDDDDTTHNAGETAAAMLNKAGEAMTFGLVGDEADARVKSWLGGGTYEEELAKNRQQEEVLERDNPGLALTSEIGGAVAAPLGALGAVGKGASMLKRAGASGLATGAMSGLYGFMEGEDGFSERAADAGADALVGAGIGSAIPVAGAGVQKVANALRRNKGIKQAIKGAPSADELAAEGNRLYQQVDDAGVQLKPEAFDNARQKIIDTLRGETGFDELPGPGSLTPKSARTMKIMDEASQRMAQEPTAALPFRSVDQMRRQAGAAAGDVANSTDQKAGVKIIEGLDDFVSNAGPDDVVTGDIEALQTALPKARETWARMKKSQLIDDAIDQQGSYMSGDASAIRNRLASLLRNKKLSSSFNDAEKAALKRVVSGSIPQQVLNYMGGGLGVMGQMGLGAAMGGLPGAVVGTMTGAGARKLSNAMTERQAEVARALIASGRAAQVPTEATPAIRNITEKLLRQGTAVSLQ